ncbi:MAG: AMP-binding protein [Armatimonadetes bacterium]|nr:AMP-binding protein [Armatimonadota bacterium]
MNSILDILKQKIEICPKKNFLAMQSGNIISSYNYSEIWEKASSIGSALKQNFKKNDKIAIITENKPEWGIALFSIYYCGAIAVPIDCKLQAPELKYILEHSEAKAVFCSLKIFESIKEIRKLALKIFILEELDKVENQNLILPSETINEDDLALIIYTSGTTGNPKGVMLTHKNLISNILMVDKLFRKHFKGARFLSILPLNHTFEITGGFLMPLYLEGSICYLENLKKETLICAMKTYKPEVMLVVPSFLNFFYMGIKEKLKNLPFSLKFIFNIFKMFLKLLQKAGLNLEKYIYSPIFKAFGGQLKYFISGAAPLNPYLIKEFAKMGFCILEGYGLTESSPIISVNTIENQRPGSVGKVLKEISLKIIKTKDALFNEGEIAVFGPNIMRGYYKALKETEEILKDGWLYTGDIGRLDEDGFLYICGRKKNIIVSQSGKKIFPEELEDKLANLPFIKEVCVIGQKKDLGEEALAIIVINEEILSREGIKKEDYFNFFKKKIKRREVIKLFEENKISAFEKEIKIDLRLLEDPIFKKLRDIISEKLNISKESISPQTNFYDELGIDSLFRLEIFLFIEKKFNIPITDEAILNFQNLQDVVEYLKLKPSNLKIKEQKFDSFDIKTILKFSIFKIIIQIVFHFFYRLFARFYLNLKIHGIENIPKEHPFILAPNHTSHIDVPTTLCSISLREINNIYTPAAADLFARSAFLTYISDLFLNIFPFYRKANYLKSLEICIELLKNKKSIILFPEGFLSEDGNLQELKTGIAYIAWESKAPIIPVFIKGAFKVMPIGQYYPKPKKVEIIFGEPIKIDDFLRESSKQQIYLKIIEKLKSEFYKLKENLDKFSVSK